MFGFFFCIPLAIVRHILAKIQNKLSKVISTSFIAWIFYYIIVLPYLIIDIICHFFFDSVIYGDIE